MNFISFVGLLSSIVGLIGWVLPTSSRHPRAVHTIYGIAIVILSASTVWYFEAYSRSKSVEIAANKLIESKSMDFTNEGFIQASLAFLEKNKDLYPDAYTRAQLICKESNCVYEKFSSDAINIANTFEGLIRGIGTMESE